MLRDKVNKKTQMNPFVYNGTVSSGGGTNIDIKNKSLEADLQESETRSHHLLVVRP
jgi:hypothetical protein